MSKKENYFLIKIKNWLLLLLRCMRIIFIEMFSLLFADQNYLEHSDILFRQYDRRYFSVGYLNRHRTGRWFSVCLNLSLTYFETQIHLSSLSFQVLCRKVKELFYVVSDSNPNWNSQTENGLILIRICTYNYFDLLLFFRTSLIFKRKIIWKVNNLLLFCFIFIRK